MANTLKFTYVQNHGMTPQMKMQAGHVAKLQMVSHICLVDFLKRCELQPNYRLLRAPTASHPGATLK